MKKQNWFLSLIFFILGVCFSSPLHAGEKAEKIEVGAFSEMKGLARLPGDWVEVRFQGVDKPTDYSLVEDEGVTVVKAASRDSASGIGREVNIRPGAFPMLVWRWKAENLVEGSSLERKSGDDYAARIYVAFDHDDTALGFFEKILYQILELIYGRRIPAKALNYIWSKKDPAGSTAFNPYTKRVKMIVVQSGEEGLNEWHDHRRNIYEDYRKAFGKPPTPVKGIGMMTDTDNTHESVTAYYGDIELWPQSEGMHTGG